MADGSVAHEHGRVAYRDHGGAGPAVVLLHGVGGNLAHWGLVAPLLADRYRLVAVDLPSHGGSTSPGAYSFDHDVDAVDAVRRGLGLERPAVVGHSYGGMIAVALGASRPDDYRAAVNIDGLGFSLDVPGDPAGRAEQLPESAAASASVDKGDADWLEAEIDREVAEAAEIGLHFDRDGEMVRRAFQLGDDGRWHSSPTIDRFVETVRALESLRLLPVYAASACRTLTVIAERRSAPGLEVAAAAQQHVDRVRAALVAVGAGLDSIASGHYPHVEVPDLTARRIREWLGP